jgi:hypothetical protein
MYKKLFVSVLMTICISFSISGCLVEDRRSNDNPALDTICRNIMRSDTAPGNVCAFNAIDNFQWERMYLFRSEESAAFMQAFMGIRWQESAVPNLYTRLIFVNKGVVVKYFDFSSQGLNGSSNQFRPISIQLMTCPDARQESSHYQILPEVCK